MSQLYSQDDHGNDKSNMIHRWIDSVRNLQHEGPGAPLRDSYGGASDTGYLVPGVPDEDAGFSDVTIGSSRTTNIGIGPDNFVKRSLESGNRGRPRYPEHEQESKGTSEEHSEEYYNILRRVDQLKANFASTIGFLDQGIAEIQDKLNAAPDQPGAVQTEEKNTSSSDALPWEKMLNDFFSWVSSFTGKEKNSRRQLHTHREDPIKRRQDHKNKHRHPHCSPSDRCFVSRFRRDRLLNATEADLVLIAQCGAAGNGQEANCRLDAGQYFSFHKSNPALKDFADSFHIAFSLLYGVSPEGISPFLRTHFHNHQPRRLLFSFARTAK